jgi:hypothetical protein
MALLRCPVCCAWVERAEPHLDELCRSCGSDLDAEAPSEMLFADDDEPTQRRAFDSVDEPSRDP